MDTMFEVRNDEDDSVSNVSCSSRVLVHFGSFDYHQTIPTSHSSFVVSVI
jgi:hypothetical protein